MSNWATGEKRCWLEVKHPPPSLEAFKSPAAFAALPRKLPGFTVHGWSIVDPSETNIEAATRVFRKKRK